jgi:cell division protein FtsW
VKQRTGHIDLPLFFSVLALMLFSMGVVYSASVDISRAHNAGDYSVLFVNHAVRVVLGLAALFLGMSLDYHIYAKYSKLILLVGIVFLVLTPFFGTTQLGAKRWLGYSVFKFQPSEFVKYALVIHLSVLLSQKQRYIDSLKDGFLPLIVWVGIVIGLITFQNNLSTVVVISLISFLMMFIGRVRMRHLLGAAAFTIPVILAYAVSKAYRLKRIFDYLNANADLSEKADAAKSQIEQAVIGLGNGGLFGVGIGMSKQRELFLPESYSDFIFAIVGEEYGFIGAIVILTLFVVIMLRGLKIAKRATDDLGRFLSVGITCVIIVNALLNAMVTTGLLPTTGLPMPLISYGGTSILFTGYAIGILLNVSTYTRIRPREVQHVADQDGLRVGEVYE